MTSFLPNVPRREWHPSQWNIVTVKSAIGTALVIAGCGDDTVSTTEDVADTVAEFEEYEDYPAEWTDYTDYSEYTDYNEDWSEYADYNEYTDWEEYTDYTESYWYPECYINEDCPDGWQCIDYYCVPGAECSTSADCPVGDFCDENGLCASVNLTEQCLAPALAQIPLPAEAGGVIVALRFVNLDADPVEELVLLRDDAVVIVDGDQAITATHAAFSLDGLAATDVDDDGTLDIVATSSTKLNTRLFLADGLGGFLDGGVGPAMMLDEVHGIDWPPGGAGELLVRTQADQAVILSSLAQPMPELGPIDQLDLEVVDELDIGDFNGDGSSDVVALGPGCEVNADYQSPGGAIFTQAIGPVGTCGLGAGTFDDDTLDDVAVVRADESFSVVSVLIAPLGQMDTATVGLIGAYQAARPTSFGAPSYAVVVQSGAELELLFTDAGLGAWCRGLFDELPPVLRYAVGDFDGDGDHELATVDTDGAVALWADE